MHNGSLLSLTLPDLWRHITKIKFVKNNLLHGPYLVDGIEIDASKGVSLQIST